MRTAVVALDAAKFEPESVSRVPPLVGQFTVAVPEALHPDTAVTAGAAG
jgi:hypothetical protein